ncbi:MAG TPA: hypothetical protein DCL72_09325 [Rhizobiales bacterium]|jgi:hypothetical protein|nr:hypothetical protein [Hyphomicrobiales bacterium]HAN62257.1 hypothetical protein [Hyphomicrobiales bacterium]
MGPCARGISPFLPVPVCQLASEAIPFPMTSDAVQIRVRLVEGPAEKTRGEAVENQGGKPE